MSRLVQALSIALTIATVCLVPDISLFGQTPDKDLLEVQHYTLTMPKVTAFWETFGSLAKVAKDHPELKDALQTDAEKHEDLADVEKRTASVPVVKAAILEHGLTVHEFVVIQVTLLQAAMGSALAPPGPDREKKAREANINPANLDFIDKHKVEIEDLQAKNLPNRGSNN